MRTLEPAITRGLLVFAALTSLSGCGSSAPPPQVVKTSESPASETEAVRAEPEEPAKPPTSCFQRGRYDEEIILGVELDGRGALRIDEWQHIDPYPKPRTVEALHQRALPRERAAPPMEDALYELIVLDEPQTLQDLADVAAMMRTHGFVRAPLDNDRADVAVYVGYVPPRLSSQQGRIAALTLLLQRDSVLVTSYVVATGAPAAVLRQVRVDREALAAACPPQAVLLALREICSHSELPCRRVAFIGGESASAHPLVTVLGMLEMVGGAPEVLQVATTFAALDSSDLPTSGAEFWLRAHEDDR